MGSPGLYEILLHPWRDMILTAAPSISHVPAAEGLSPPGGTFTMMCMWGFSQRYSTTVPLRVNHFELSNIANEWWAKTGVVAQSNTLAANSPIVFKFMWLSP